MSRTRAIGGMIGREALLALVVLAMVFLNFGHQSASAASAWQVSGVDSYCGDPLLPGGTDHAPCHACRIGNGADLPPAPALDAPVQFFAEPVRFCERSPLVFVAAIQNPAQPRAPPSA